jgi:putative tryptophan/tyrosine transport system substrate-binding protein
MSLAKWIVIYALLVNWSVCIAEAQQQSHVPRVGLLATGDQFDDDSERFVAFQEELRKLGYVAGNNIILERRSARTPTEQSSNLTEAAKELIALPVDVLVPRSTTEALAVQKLKTDIPVVFWSSEPLAVGLVHDEERPEATVTGITGPGQKVAEIVGLVRDIIPNARRLAVLINPSYALAPKRLQEVEELALSDGLELLILRVNNPTEIEQVFSRITQSGVDAVFVINHPMFGPAAKQLAEAALKNRLPLFSPYRETAEAGALIAWEPDWREWASLTAAYVVKVISGTKIRDLPVARAKQQRIFVNLGTAKVLGLHVPESVTRRAYKVLN